MKFVKCVLLVDDDRATNFFNKMMLNRHESFDEINTVQSGMEAIEYLNKVQTNKATRPNLILLDINMPGMNGWEFLTLFEKLDVEITKDIKVILLSTSSDPGDVMKTIDNYRVSDFINKPLSLKLLNNVINNHFASALERG